MIGASSMVVINNASRMSHDGVLGLLIVLGLAVLVVVPLIVWESYCMKRGNMHREDTSKHSPPQM